MTDEENAGVALEEVASPTESESAHDDSNDHQRSLEQRKRNDAEYNWAEVRRTMRDRDQKIEELEKKLSQITNPQQQKSVEDDLDRLAEDDILTVAQAKKLMKHVASKTHEESLRQYQASTAEERINLKFPDYSDIVTNENIELLRKTQPAVAKALAKETDPYEQAVAAYEVLKLMTGQSVGNSREKKKAMENIQKPVSVQSVAKQSAIGNAHMFENGLTPELKKSLWSEMQEIIKRA